MRSANALGAALLVASLTLSCAGPDYGLRRTSVGRARSDDPWLVGPPCAPDTPAAVAPRVDVRVAGVGEPVEPGMTVRVHYVASLPGGAALHDTHADDMPSEIILGSTRTFCGFERSLLGMRAGEERRVVVPASLGFGAGERPAGVPANSDLVFVIDLYLPTTVAKRRAGGSPGDPFAPQPGAGLKSTVQQESEFGRVPPP